MANKMKESSAYLRQLPFISTSTFRTCATALVLFLGGIQYAIGQENAANDTFKQGTVAFEKGSYQESEKLLNQAIELITSEGLTEPPKESVYYLLGNVQHKLGKPELALHAYLQSAFYEEKKAESATIATVYASIADSYHQLKAPQKAIEFYKKAHEKATAAPQKTAISNKLGQLYFQTGQYETAATIFDAQLKNPNATALEKALLHSQLSMAYKETNRLPEASEQANTALTIYLESQQLEPAAFAANNLGFLYRQQQKLPESEAILKKAVLLYTQVIQQTDLAQVSPVLLQNLAGTYAALGQFGNAENYFQKALEASARINQPVEQAEALNLLAVNEYKTGRLRQAQVSVEAAIETGKTHQLKPQLADSYLILSEILSQDGDFEGSQAAYKQHQQIKDDIQKERREKENQLQQAILAAERNENDLYQNLGDQERKALTVKQLKLEAAQREQELALLKQQQELQAAQIKGEQLEKERVAQALQLANGQLEAAEKEKAIASLQKAQELQKLALRQKELEEKDREKAIELLEAEKALQNQQLEEEERNRKYYFIGFALVAAFLLFVLFSLYQRNKAFKLISTQKREIDLKNEELLASEEELRQNNEELMTTQELLAQQKEELQEQYGLVTQSIAYAQTIQQAFLPTDELRLAIFPKSMLYFKPRDVVSGDFYWCSAHNGISVVSVIDCTGHGVPGAFMSLVGSNLLNEIIHLKGVLEPAEILTLLDEGVRHKLNQENNFNTDGMDLGICVVHPAENGKIPVHYGGAKHRLFILKHSNGELLEFKSDRKHVGGNYGKEHEPFTQQILYLEPADIIYLTTDGYIDQNDEARNSFNSKRFKNLLTSMHKVPIEDQKELFDTAMAAHKGKAHQRDDITILSVQL